MTENRIVFIPQEKLEGGYGVNLYRPTYKDYSSALKLYPGETRENPQGPGYTFEEFFCALCIRDSEGKEPDRNPKDAIERFSLVQLKDKQFIARTFIAAFLLNQDNQDEAESFADALYDSDPHSLSYTVTKDQLPWQSADFTFNRPTSAVQVSVTKAYTSAKVNGCLWDEMFFLSCLTHINGEPVPQISNVLNHVSDMEVLDIQYMSAVFIKMFSMNMNERKSANDLGKEWRTSLLQSPQSNKPKNAIRVKAPEAAN